MTLLVYLLLAIPVVLVGVRPMRAEKVACRLLLAVAPLVLCGPAMLRDRVLAPIDLAYGAPPLSAHRELLGPGPFSPGILSDVFTQMIPWRAAVRRALAAGEWPLWNPSILNGDVLLGAGQPAALSPLTWLELLLPIELSLGLAAAITLLIASLGAYWFFRSQRFSELASVAGGTCWSWSGFVLFWLHWPMGRCAALYPWLLLATASILRKPSRGAACGLAIVLALLLVSGHPETALHAVALALAFAGAALVGRRLRGAARPVLYATGAGLLALLLSAAAILPFVDALGQTREVLLRQHPLARPHDLPVEAAAVRALAEVVPFVFGMFGKAGSDVPASWMLPDTAYLGSAVLAFVLLGAAAARFRHRAFVLGSFIFCIGAATSMPPFTSTLARLPLFSVALNERLAFGAAFSLAWLLAAGLDGLFGTRRRLAPWAARALSGGTGRAMACIATTACAAVLALAASRAAARVHVPETFYRESAVAFVLFAATGAALILYPRRRTWVPVFALIAIVIGQRWTEMHHFFPSFPREAFYPAVPPLAAAADVGEPARVVGLGETWVPNASAVYGLEDPRGSQAMTLARQWDTLGFWSVPRPTWFNRVDSLRAPFLRFLNVRYALVPAGFRPGGGWRFAARGSGVDLLANRRAAPRFFVPREVRLAFDAQALLAELESERDFVRRVRIEPFDGRAPRQPVSLANPAGALEIERRGSGYRLHSRLQGDAWVASSVTAWRGWRVRADGEDLRLAYANHAFLGFLAPAGERTIEIFYRPESFDVGLTLSSLGIICLAAVALWPRIRRSWRDPPRAERAR